MRILVVEKDRTLRKALAISLGAQGNLVDCAPSPQELFAPERAADVVLLGLAPADAQEDKSTAEAIVGLRSRYQAPVIALSDDRRQCGRAEPAGTTVQGAGADRYLLKPFGIAQLLECIDDVVHGDTRAASQRFGPVRGSSGAWPDPRRARKEMPGPARNGRPPGLGRAC